MSPFSLSVPPRFTEEESETRPAIRHSVLLVEVPEDCRVHAAPPVLAGCECITVPGVGAALARLERMKPLMTLVGARVFDTLPGVDVLARLRRHPSHAGVPVVLLASTETPTELVEAAWRAGAVDCMLRPVSLPLVRERVAALTAPAAERRAPRVALVVDADGDFRDSLTRLLALVGFQLLVARTEEEALARATAFKGRVDAVVVRGLGASSQALLQRLLAMPAAPAARLLVLPRGCLAPVGGAVELLEREATAPRDVLERLLPLLGRGARELRAHEAVPFFCPVQFRELGREEPWHCAYSHEVSPGGLFLRTLSPPRAGAALELRILLTTTAEVLEGSGVVSWSQPWSPPGELLAPAGLGLQFLGMSPKRLARLRELCGAAMF
jgi:DNA-binding response OmpR family regulator